MKYGESIFDILYLAFAITAGVLLLVKKRGKAAFLMGIATLALGVGDAFHLIPRVLRYFSEGDYTFYLGLGKLITSVTMTAFYVLMYRLWLLVYEKEENKPLSFTVYALALLRVILCALPQNQWFSGEGSVLWGILRNIPFVALGGIIVWLFFVTRREKKTFASVWMLVTLSFLFYIPVAVAASLVPLLGMLMMPKTVCYILLIALFLRYAFANGGNSSDDPLKGEGK